MRYFDFSTDIIDTVVREINKAKKYIRIAVFQLHNQIIFSALTKKLNEGVKIEILTLPYDSINPDVQERVTKSFEDLKKIGANIQFLNWNIGDPGNTKTAVARWYSFHGKFLVTDSSAIVLSANFTDKSELDAALVIDDKKSINKYNKQFERLKEYFVIKAGKYRGNLRDRIEKSVSVSTAKEIFSLPANVSKQHKDSWIRDYPDSLCKESYSDVEGLFITPFDCKGRYFIQGFLENAREFAYISTESFTDPGFPNFLIRLAQKGIKISVLTGMTSRDFTDRLQNNVREMLAAGIEIRSFNGDLHSKLMITDKGILISSINLNMINLGFSKKRGYWRENTETIGQYTDEKTVKIAAKKYLEIFNKKSSDVEDKLLEKLGKNVENEINVVFDVKLDKEVKRLLAIAVLNKEKKVKSFIIEIGKAMKQLVKMFSKIKVDKEIFYMALVLYILSERKRDYNELSMNLNGLNNDELNRVINLLIERNLITKDGEFFKKSLI